MPVWIEIAVNVIGYAGFVAIASLHKSPGERARDDATSVS